jgi:hypothetical protein
MNLAALNRIDDGKIITALNAAWNKSHQGGNPKTKPLVAFGVDDDNMLLWFNDRSSTATEFAKEFLTKYDDITASVDGKKFTSAGLIQIYTGYPQPSSLGLTRVTLGYPM